MGLTVEQICQQIQAPKGSTFQQWYEYMKVVREAYVSQDAVAELTRDVMIDGVAAGLDLLELRISLLSTVESIRKYGQITEPFWTVARKTLEAIIHVRNEVQQGHKAIIDLILSISCQNKYLEYVNDYILMMKDYASEIIAIDLTNEKENPPTMYRPAVEKIQSEIEFLTIHCMETMGPGRGWMALELRPHRIGHGINVIQDPRLVEEIKKAGIVLEVCPLSNLLTGVATAENHPFRRLEQAGLTLTINHDGLNDTSTLQDDYDFVRDTFEYSDHDMAIFRENAWQNAFRNM